MPLPAAGNEIKFTQALFEGVGQSLSSIIAGVEPGYCLSY